MIVCFFMSVVFFIEPWVPTLRFVGCMGSHLWFSYATEFHTQRISLRKWWSTFPKPLKLLSREKENIHFLKTAQTLQYYKLHVIFFAEVATFKKLKLHILKANNEIILVYET